MDRLTTLPPPLPNRTIRTEGLTIMPQNLPELTSQQKLELATLLLIAVREGWTLENANDEQGYFDPDFSFAHFEMMSNQERLEYCKDLLSELT